MFLDWKNQYSQNDYTYQSNPQIQCNPYQITMAFFTELEQQKIRKRNQGKLPFIIISKTIKYLGINLPKETKDLYFENYKTLMKEIKDHIKRWKDIPSSWIGK